MNIKTYNSGMRSLKHWKPLHKVHQIEMVATMSWDSDGNMFDTIWETLDDEQIEETDEFFDHLTS